MAAEVAYRRGWKVVAILLGVFGLVTIIRGGSVLFNIGGQREAMGHIVPFVLQMNFAAGFLYLGAAIGLFLRKPWPQYVLLLALAMVIYASFFLYTHIQHHGAYEPRTVVAMTVRTVLTFILWFVTRYLAKPNKAKRAAN